MMILASGKSGRTSRFLYLSVADFVCSVDAMLHVSPGE